MTHVTVEVLDSLAYEAKVSPRRRQHRNLHASAAEPCQRLLNAVWPDSYIRPHRHSAYKTPECLLALRGTFALLEFDADGEILSVHRFGAGAELAIVEIPPDAWHTVLALTDGAVLFEAKSGPYSPEAAKTFAPWAPPEGSAGQAAYLAALHRAASVGSDVHPPAQAVPRRQPGRC